MEDNASSVYLTSDPESVLKSKQTLLNQRSETTHEVIFPDGWEPLPPDANYKNPDYRLFRYRGVTLDSLHLNHGIMEQFCGRPSDVIVASFPKSGTTWLQEIVWRVTHREEIAEERENGVPLEFRFPLLELQSQKGVMEMASLEDLPEPRFIKTHLHYHMLPESVFSSGAKVLYVSRDARDVCVSFYYFAKMNKVHKYRGTFSDFRDSFVNNAVMYGPYREHVKGYMDRSDTVLCLTYEQMHQDRASVVRKVADFLGVSLNDNEVGNIVANTSFEVMKANPSTNFHQWKKSGMIPPDEEGAFMRKGVVGDWRSHFNEAESNAFMKWRSAQLYNYWT